MRIGGSMEKKLMYLPCAAEEREGSGSLAGRFERHPAAHASDSKDPPPFGWTPPNARPIVWRATNHSTAPFALSLRRMPPRGVEEMLSRASRLRLRALKPRELPYDSPGLCANNTFLLFFPLDPSLVSAAFSLHFFHVISHVWRWQRCGGRRGRGSCAEEVASQAATWEFNDRVWLRLVQAHRGGG